MKYTIFHDMHSGGGLANDFQYGYIEADEQTAVTLFTDKYGDPDHVTCECCGPDYSIFEYDSLEELLQHYPDAIKLL